MSNISDFEFSKVDGGYAVEKYIGMENKVIIPDVFEGEPILEIGICAFESNLNCQEISIPNTVKTVRECAFFYCEFLENIKFSENLIKIERNAFFGCTFLTNIILPKNLEYVGEQAFASCGLTTVVAESENTVLGKDVFEGNYFLSEISANLWKYLDKEQILNVILFEFQRFHNLSKVEQKEITTFVKRRSYLKKGIFESDNIDAISALIDNKIKLSLEDLNDYLEISIKEERVKVTAVLLDYKNKNFTQQEIEAQKQRAELVELGLEPPTFKELSRKWLCKKTKDGIVIKGYLKSQVKEIIPKSLDDGTKIIDIHSANDFSPIEELVILAEIESLRPETFASCNTLRTVHLPNTLKDIGNACFNKCENLESINFPDEITHLPPEMFADCKKLKYVHLPQSLVSIKTDPWAMGFFAYCLGLEKVVLPPSLTDIQKGIFNGCTSLKEVTIPKGVTEIGSYAFNNCKNLQPLILPKDLQKIGDSAFANCYKMLNEDGYIIMNNMIFTYDGIETEIKIPDGVTHIYDFAFSGKEKITKVHLPKSIKFIGRSAFNNCYSLHTVTFEDMKNCDVHFDRWSIRDFMSNGDKMSTKEITLPKKATYYRNSFEDFTLVVGGILLDDEEK